ncbi:MAG: MBL fold metallo-hydrolase, partial [Armatimonadetes bacterium]|nr:MBL fold metallo-hydrolase [Armatimonadota bacterium]
LHKIVPSHPHADHARAFTYLLDKRRPRIKYPLQVIRSNDPGWSPTKREWLKPYRKALTKNGVDQVMKDFREAFDFGNKIKTEVFSDGTTRPFYRSVFIQLRMGDAKVLFTGDAYMPYEVKMRDGFGDRFFKSDVLKVTHHGSKDGTDEDVLKAINPGIAIVSTGKPGGGGTGHSLSTRTRRVLKKQRIKIFETYLDKNKKVKQRDIILRSDGKTYKNKGVLYEVKRLSPKFDH